MQRSNPRGRTRTFSFAAAMAALFVVGCSDTNVPGEVPPNGVLGRDELAAEIAEWRCDGFATCCDDAGIQFDRRKCLEVQRDKRLTKWAEAQSIGMGFSQAGAAECAEAIRETAPTCPPRLGKMCDRVLDALLEVGEACERKRDCLGWREGLVACIDGRCTERFPPGADCGRPCESASCSPRGVCDPCRTDSTCMRTEDGSERCVQVLTVVATEDEPCDSIGESAPPAGDSITRAVCDEGLFCGATRVGGEKVCRALVGLGGRCPIFVPCEPDLVCENEVCVELVPRPAGEPCTRDPECQEGLECQAGTCTSRRVASLGQACPAGRDCEEGTFCHRYTSRCTAYVSLGEPCAYRQDFLQRCDPDLACQFDLSRDPPDGRCVTADAYRCALATDAGPAFP